VKIVRAGDSFLLHFGRREKQLLIGLLKRYPCIPSTHRLQRSSVADESQHLLDEALGEQRLQIKKQLEEFLAEPRRFEITESGSRLSLALPEMECLLQILNDIRVGSWIQLGSPDPQIQLKLLNETTAAHFWAMEMAGQFEMALLHAMQS